MLPVLSVAYTYRIQGLGPDNVVQLVSVTLESVDIAGQEIHAVVIQRLDVAIEYGGGQIVVDRGVAIVRLLDELGHHHADLLVTLARSQDRLQNFALGGCGGPNRQGQQWQQE